MERVDFRVTSPGSRYTISSLVLLRFPMHPVRDLHEIERFAHEHTEALSERVSGCCEPVLASSRRGSPRIDGHHLGRWSTRCALSMAIWGASQKSVGPRVNGLESGFPTSIHFPFASLHFRTLPFPLCLPTAEVLCAFLVPRMGGRPCCRHSPGSTKA